ncbi:MAG: hypothetical protein ACPGLV_16765 [Bacteroidia bacterium]
MYYGEQKEIPSIFFDTVEETHINKCQFCEKDLLNSNQPYLIEKAFKQKEVINEYAVCMNCAQDMQSKMSKESMQSIEKYMMEKSQIHERQDAMQDISQRIQVLTDEKDNLSNKAPKPQSTDELEALIDNDLFDDEVIKIIDKELAKLYNDKEQLYSQWFGHCMVKNTPKSEQNEYTIQGMFMGNKMVQNHLYPQMLGTQALEEIQELLSPETREELNRIKDEFFNIPPELAELFKDPKFTLGF